MELVGGFKDAKKLRTQRQEAWPLLNPLAGLSVARKRKNEKKKKKGMGELASPGWLGQPDRPAQAVRSTLCPYGHTLGTLGTA